MKTSKLINSSRTKFIKHSVYLSVFLCALLLSACSEKPAAKPESVQVSPPLLSLSELLSASDFKQGIAQAVESNDEMAIKHWQEQLLSVAHEARLSPSDLQKLQGKQGFMFLEFQGKLINYDRDFMHYLMNFEDLTLLFDKYPELSALHAYSEKIAKQRDEEVSNIVQSLSGSSSPPSEILEQAREQWRQAINSTASK